MTALFYFLKCVSELTEDIRQRYNTVVLLYNKTARNTCIVPRFVTGSKLQCCVSMNASTKAVLSSKVNARILYNAL
jgi:hypothetical protein